MVNPEASAIQPKRPLNAWIVAAFALAIAVLGWPRVPSDPVWGSDYYDWGLDLSWHVALHLAPLQRLQWGRDALFTYGPLGFLSVPLFVSAWTAALALLFVAVVTWALAATLLLSFERLLAIPLACVATLFGVALMGMAVPEAASIAGVLAAGLVLSGRFGPRVEVFASACLAAFASVLLLVKASAGVALATAVPFLVAAQPNRVARRSLGATSAFVCTLCAAWVAAGQSLAWLPAWLSGTARLAIGYGEAMAIDDPALNWHYVAFAMFLAAFWLCFAIGADRGRPRQTALLAGMLVATGFIFFKAGFVRHWGSEHPSITFSFLLIAPLAVRWLPARRGLGLALAASAVVLLEFVSGDSPARNFDVFSRAHFFRNELWTLLNPRKREEVEASARARLRQMIGLPPHVLAALEGYRVHVDPQDVAIAWAYGFQWAPVPIFQLYAAYTPDLDEVNARSLGDARGPDRILRRRLDESIDGRNPLWETPEYALVRLCRYREIAVSERWQVLERGPDRCGLERQIDAKWVQPGELVNVPLPSAQDRIVVAHIEKQSSFADHLRTALLRPRSPLYGWVDGKSQRLVPASIAGPLLMRIPTTSGWSPDFDGGLQISTFAVNTESRPFLVRFGEIPLARP